MRILGRVEGFSSMTRMKAPLLAPQDRLKGFWDQTLSLDPAMCAVRSFTLPAV
jgi:hypothetical protein